MMDAPLKKFGIIDADTNILMALLLGILFGYALQRAGFANAKKISHTFYLKDVDVPVVMFTAIATGALGLWGLGLLGVMDLSMMYFLETYLWPMMLGGFIFGIGMVTGGYCPGTAVAALATGKIDALVFIIGFFLGSLAFGDFFTFWNDIYMADFRGVWRLDEALGISIGTSVLLVVAVAIGGSIGLKQLQKKLWGQKS